MDISITEFGHIHCCKKGFQLQINNSIGNRVEPDDTAHYELSHLDLHCLQRYLYWYAGMKRLNFTPNVNSIWIVIYNIQNQH